MSMHSAKSLFDKNINSAADCLALFDGVVVLKTSLQVDWILRAAIVFVVSALDAYFHDKVRYRVGGYSDLEAASCPCQVGGSARGPCCVGRREAEGQRTP